MSKSDIDIVLPGVFEKWTNIDDDDIAKGSPATLFCWTRHRELWLMPIPATVDDLIRQDDGRVTHLIVRAEGQPRGLGEEITGVEFNCTRVRENRMWPHEAPGMAARFFVTSWHRSRRWVTTLRVPFLAGTRKRLGDGFHEPVFNNPDHRRNGTFDGRVGEVWFINDQRAFEVPRVPSRLQSTIWVLPGERWAPRDDGVTSDEVEQFNRLARDASRGAA